MTPGRARTLVRRWFVVFVVAIVLRTTLTLVGIDLLDLPLGLVMALAFGFAMHHSGWIDGYQARTEEREDA